MANVGSGNGVEKVKGRGLDASIERVGDVAVVRLKGRISINGGDVSLRNVVLGAFDRGDRKVLLEMSKVSFVDSSGVGELVAAYFAARKRGGAVRLCCLSDKVFDLLRLVSLLRFFDVSLDEEGALDAFAEAESPSGRSAD